MNTDHSRRSVALSTLITIAASFFISTASSEARAALPEFKGSFQFHSRIELLAAVHNQVVHTQTPEGQLQLEQLRSEGYECTNALSSTWRCRRFLKNPTLPESVSRRLIARHFGKLKLTYGAVTGTAQLINDSPSLKEWRVWQKIELNGRQYPLFVYMEAQGIPKLAIGDTQAGLGEWIRLGDDGLPRYFDSPRENETDYLVELVLD